MFKKRRLDAELDSLKYDFDRLYKQYWDLKSEFNKLLGHLKIDIVDVPKHKEVRDVK